MIGKSRESRFLCICNKGQKCVRGNVITIISCPVEERREQGMCHVRGNGRRHGMGGKGYRPRGNLLGKKLPDTKLFTIQDQILTEKMEALNLKLFLPVF